MLLRFIPALCCAAIFVGATRQADAALILSLTNGASTTSITDNLAGDLNPAVGSIGNFSLIVGSFEVTFAQASSISPGGAALAYIDVGFTVRRLNNTNSGSLVIDVSDTGFTSPAGSVEFTSSSTINTLVSGSTVTFESFISATSPIGPHSPGSPISTPIVAPATYSLRNVTTFNAPVSDGKGQVSGATSVHALPEAGSLVAWGFGLACLGLVGIARRRHMALQPA